MNDLYSLFNNTLQQAANIGTQSLANAINPQSQTATAANNQIQAQAVADNLSTTTKWMIGGGIGLGVLLILALVIRK